MKSLIISIALVLSLINFGHTVEITSKNVSAAESLVWMNENKIVGATLFAGGVYGTVVGIKILHGTYQMMEKSSHDVSGIVMLPMGVLCSIGGYYLTVFSGGIALESGRTLIYPEDKKNIIKQKIAEYKLKLSRQKQNRSSTIEMTTSQNTTIQKDLITYKGENIFAPNTYHYKGKWVKTGVIFSLDEYRNIVQDYPEALSELDKADGWYKPVALTGLGAFIGGLAYALTDDQSHSWSVPIASVGLLSGIVSVKMREGHLVRAAKIYNESISPTPNNEIDTALIVGVDRVAFNIMF